VVAIGHSAGGQLAVWAAGRHTLPAAALGAAPRVRVHGVVSQAGVLDLVTASAQGLGGTAVSDLMGGTPAQVPARYAIGDPVELVPIGVPVRCVHSATDGVVPLSQSQQYIAAATKVGDDATLIPVTGDHFALINVDSSAWRAVVALVPSLISG
jgi:pimeloyl-ACP methyl ester carboxylesterase